MTDKKGIRSLFAIDVLPEEQEAQDRAKETIMQRLNVKPNELQAAEDRYITPLPEIKFEPTFYQPTKTKEQLEEEKFKRDFEKEYGDEAIKKDILKKINANKRSGKRDYEGFSSSDMIVAEDIREKARAKLKHLQPKKDPTIQQQVINYSPKKVQPKIKKNFIGLKGGITPDQNHPDGFRINDDVICMMSMVNRIWLDTFKKWHTNMMVLLSQKLLSHLIVTTRAAILRILRSSRR